MSTEKKPISEAKADLLRSAAKPKGKCKGCSDKDAAAASPIKSMLARLGAMDMPSPPGGCDCDKKDPKKSKAVVVTVMKDDGKQPLNERPVEEAEKHQTSPFTLRCVAAITGGTPKDRAAESKAFAICNAQKNKSDKNLDKAALKRPGYKSRKAEFVHSLDAVKKKQKKNG